MPKTTLTVVLTCMILAGQAMGQDANGLTNPKAQKLQEINAELESLEQQLTRLNGRKNELERQRNELALNALAPEDDDLANIRYPVVRVVSEQNVILLMNGREQEVLLAGVLVKLGRTADAVRLLNRELALGRAYARCLNDGCTEVRLYSRKGVPSLNCELLSSDLAFLHGTPLDCSNDDVSLAASTGATTAPDSSGGVYSPSGSPRPTPGKDVQVRGYYRKDGTYVRPHTRSAPRRRN